MDKGASAIPALSVIIVSYNTRALLLRCIDALRAAADAADICPLELIVVDNASDDGSLAAVRASYPDTVRVANTANRGFAAANNQGLALVRAPAVLLLNSDAFVTAEALRETLDLLARRPRAGLVGLRLLNPDGTTQAEWGKFPSLLDDLAAASGADRFLRRPRSAGNDSGPGERPADWVQGAFILARTAAVSEVGGIDEAFFMYSEEIDWCHRFWRHGWQVWYRHDGAVTHLGGGSSARDDLPRRQALYRSRLGLRRRLGGPIASFALWLGMLAGLSLRVVGRAFAYRLARQAIGRHTADDDWRLLGAIGRLDPLARWAVAGTTGGVPLPTAARATRAIADTPGKG